MNNFGTLTFAAWVIKQILTLRQRTTHQKLNASNICILMRFWRYYSSFWSKSASEDSDSLPRNQVEDSETGSSDEQSQLLMLRFWSSVEDSETRSSDERLQLLKTWRFWRPSAKNSEDRSSDERLQIPRTWSSEDQGKWVDSDQALIEIQID